MVYILLCSIGLIILCIFQYFNAEHKKPSVLTYYSGGLGSGKTLNAVSDVLHHYQKQKTKLFFQKLFRVPRAYRVCPSVFSNIPIVLEYKHHKPAKWSYQLTADHITLKSRLPEGATVLIDEVGQIADQYSWDKTLVKENLREFIRFFRHYVNGFIGLTDQSSGEVVIPFRRRFNYAYNCEITKFFPCKLFWLYAKTYFLEVTFVEEVVTIKNPEGIDQKPQYFIKFHNPFSRKKFYDSRCYSERYTCPFQPFNVWKKYKTNDLLEIPATEKDKELYKKYR